MRFRQSPLFLGYYSKLLHSVNEDDDILTGREEARVTQKEEENEILDLDDPEELWKRSALPYVLFRYVFCVCLKLS